MLGTLKSKAAQHDDIAAPATGHIEHFDLDEQGPIIDERAPEAMGRDASDVPRSYWWSRNFIGSIFAIALGYTSAAGGFVMIAPLLSNINADIGPSASITWVALTYLLCQTVTYLIVGRLSDVFGRRWFFIIGNCIGLIGAVLGATAYSVNQIIGAEVFIGVASGFQISFFWVIAELVPMKWRYMAASFCYIVSTPLAPMAPKIAFAFQTETSVKWRGCFYTLIGTNTTAALLFFFFYYPPTFKMLHRRRAAIKMALTFDWIGLVLYLAAVLLIVLGLNWGGGLYPWKSAAVIGSILGGAVAFGLFIAWEAFLPIKASEPFLPLHLFKNLPFQASAWLAAIGAAAFFGFTLIWPQAVAVLYPGLSSNYQGTLYGLPSMGFSFGEMTSGIWARHLGPKPTIIGAVTIGAPLLMATATDPQNLALSMGLLTTGCVFIGIMEGVAITSTTIPLRSQEEIGTAGGLSGTIRSLGSVVAVAVYSTTLTNSLAVKIPQYVPIAAEKAGLPTTSVPMLLNALTGKITLNSANVPGLTTAVTEASEAAYRFANAEAYKTVFFASFAFGGLGIILAWFVSNENSKTDTYIAGHLHKTSEEKALEDV